MFCQLSTIKNGTDRLNVCIKECVCAAFKNVNVCLVFNVYRVSIKESSVAKLGSVCRRIYRIFSHAYFHHRQIFDEYEVSAVKQCALLWVFQCPPSPSPSPLAPKSHSLLPGNGGVGVVAAQCGMLAFFRWWVFKVIKWFLFNKAACLVLA